MYQVVHILNRMTFQITTNRLTMLLNKTIRIFLSLFSI